jgi:hypothetical protein
MWGDAAGGKNEKRQGSSSFDSGSYTDTDTVIDIECLQRGEETNEAIAKRQMPRLRDVCC